MHFQNCRAVLSRLWQASAAGTCRISYVSSRCVAAMYRMPWTSALPQQSVGREQEWSRATGHTGMLLWNVCKHIPDYTASHPSMQDFHSSICSQFCNSVALNRLLKRLHLQTQHLHQLCSCLTKRPNDKEWSARLLSLLQSRRSDYTTMLTVHPVDF